MKWKELAAEILTMDAEQQEMDVTVLLMESNEFLPVQDESIGYNDPTGHIDHFDQLDDNHPYIMLDA